MINGLRSNENNINSEINIINQRDSVTSNTITKIDQKIKDINTYLDISEEQRNANSKTNQAQD